MLVSLLPVCARNCFLPSESPVKETFPSLLRADPTPKRGQNISEEGEVKKKKKKEKSTGARKAQQVSTSKTPHVLQKGLSSTVELHLLKASSADKVKKSRINQPK